MKELLLLGVNYNKATQLSTDEYKGKNLKSENYIVDAENIDKILEGIKTWILNYLSASSIESPKN